MVNAKKQIIIAFLFVTSCLVASCGKVPGSDEEDRDDAKASPLVGNWEGTLKEKDSEGNLVAANNAEFEITGDGLFQVTYPDVESAKASGTYNDSGESLLVKFKESTILPLFNTKVIVQLDYRMLGSILELKADEATFTLQKKDRTNSNGDNQNPTNEQLGVWICTGISGKTITLHISSATEFWGTISKAESSEITMSGSVKTEDDHSYLLIILNSPSTGIINSKMRLTIDRSVAELKILQQSVNAAESGLEYTCNKN